jgi:hypothetical protein
MFIPWRSLTPSVILTDEEIIYEIKNKGFKYSCMITFRAADQDITTMIDFVDFDLNTIHKFYDWTVLTYYNFCRGGEYTTEYFFKNEMDVLMAKMLLT